MVHVNTADITWLNTGESARRLGITPRTLYRFIDDGKVPAYRFGRVIRLKESEVAQFIEECRIAPGTLDISALEPEESEPATPQSATPKSATPKSAAPKSAS